MGPGDQPTATRPPPPRLSPLYKHNSWSPDIVRDEEWLRRKDQHHLRHRLQHQSVTDEDIDELKACIELGFGFAESDDRLSSTLPALGLYYAVNKQYHDTIVKSPDLTSSSVSDSGSGSSSSLDNTHAIFGSGDDPRIMKTRLRQWAQVVACSLRQSSSSPLSSL
ncbi:hypothetical protein Hanom_Chr17g01568051 [Helianthus anomalus]